MKPVVKGVLIGCSVLVVLGVAAIVAIGWFVKTRSGDLVAKGKVIHSEGATFGRGTSESQCVATAMDRYRNDRGVVGGIKQRVWLSGCLETSTVETNFCDGVPAQDAIAGTVAWRVARCSDLGFAGDSTCPNILAEVQTYCGGARKKKISPQP